MGILNVTPDSFFDGGRYLSIDEGVAQGIRLSQEGADILDIGGESTRPGAHPISEQEELARVIPLIHALHKKVQIPISIDTTKPEVAKEAIKAGAAIINDVSGLSHPEMVKIAFETGVKVCLMHSQGIPLTMQDNPKYPQGIIEEMLLWFSNRVIELSEAGLDKKNIILDPGIGFGKTVDHNYEILHNLTRIKALGFPLLVGLSRKSFMGKVLGKKAVDLLPATLALNTLAMLSHTDIIRVHDVREHKDCSLVIEKFLGHNKKCSFHNF